MFCGIQSFGFGFVMWTQSMVKKLRNDALISACHKAQFQRARATVSLLHPTSGPETSMTKLQKLHWHRETSGTGFTVGLVPHSN